MFILNCRFQRVFKIINLLLLTIDRILLLLWVYYIFEEKSNRKAFKKLVKLHKLVITAVIEQS